MNHTQKQGCFANEIERVIDYFRKEFDMTYADVIGVLRIISSELEFECHERQHEEEGTDSGDQNP